MARTADQSIETKLRTILSQSSREVSTESQHQCPDEETVAAYLEGALAGDEAQKVASHVRVCADCAEIAILARPREPRAARPHRSWAIAATLLAWVTGGIAVGYFTIAIATWLLRATLLERAQALLGGSVAASDFSLGIARGPTLTVDGISFSTDRHSITAGSVETVSVTANWRDLLRGRLSFAHLLLIKPSLQVRQTASSRVGPGGITVSGAAASFGQEFAGLLAVVNAMDVSEGEVTFLASREQASLPLALSNLTVSARAAPEGRGAFTIKGLIPDQGKLVLAGTFTRESGTPARWQADLTVGPVSVARLTSAVPQPPLGLESGHVTLSGSFAGGREPLYGLGLVEVENGSVHGWQLLRPLFIGRRVPPELSSLAGLKPLLFEKLAARWRYAAQGLKIESLTIKGRAFTLTLGLKIASTGRLTGSGSLELSRELAEVVSRTIPGSSLSTNDRGLLRAPLLITGDLTAPQIVFASQ